MILFLWTWEWNLVRFTLDPLQFQLFFQLAIGASMAGVTDEAVMIMISSSQIFVVE